MTVLATHNRSGSITYRHLFGNTYEFTVTTCTKTSSDADRPELEIVWGDGTSDTIPRIEPILFNLDYDVQINTYIGVHTFTGPDTYIISVEDPNRNFGVLNITSSVDKVFCIQTVLVISPFIGTGNNSLVIEDCPCPEYACINSPWCYNLSAYDPDGDSLAYSLIPCKGEDCLEMIMPGVYQYPHQVAGGIMSIDPISGTLCWDSPEMEGEFNIAILIQEYRLGFFVGSVIQDMQFVVMTNCDNLPPNIVDVADTCVFAGDSLNIAFDATDTEHTIEVSATGAVFHLTDNPAVFDDSTGYLFATGRFLWNPTCAEASDDYYAIIVHTQDNHPEIPLTDLTTFRVKVKIPAVTGLTVTPTGNSMTLLWNASVCSGIDHYNIYRSIDSTDNNSVCCENGTAELMGYALIGSTADTTYIDNGPLIVGNIYCYMITAVNASGVESCLSEQICDHLDFEIPVMTHVSVLETATGSGKDSVLWSYPKELNEISFPGPYHYALYRSPDFTGGTESSVYVSAPQILIDNPDTTFFDIVLDTDLRPYTYRVELYSNGALVGSSLPASSVFLTLIPNDNQLELVWEESHPWTNTEWEVYKETPGGSGTFVLIATLDSMSYIDTGLVNGVEYCYKIRSRGGYTADGIINPILNWSQEACASPIDLTAPCAPVLEITGDCDLEETYLTWTNPNNSCADDVTRYNLYFAEFEGDSLELLATFSSDLDTFFTHSGRGSIAGCYYVTALDSVQYNNESEPSNIACIDNCEGYYELPNIFTPDGSGANDLFHPLLPYKFVKKIELEIFNRWGDVVFKTEDPQIDWDGTDKDTGKPLYDGVYFYTVTVYEIKLSGLVPRSFHGNLQIIHSH